MRLFGHCILILVRIFDLTARLVFRIQQLLTGILPALLPPEKLIRLIRNHYDASYQGVAAHLSETCDKCTLESWEKDVLACHNMTSGTVLVPGAGMGRESIALAQRGFVVVGIDINRQSSFVPAQQAMTQGVQPLFAQADFLAIPIGPDRVDYVFMSGIMYGSIPGRKERQAWLRSLRICMSELDWLYSIL